MAKIQNDNTKPGTKKEVEAKEVVPEPEPLKFEDIPMWRNPDDNLPVFVASADDKTTMSLIEAKKFKVYYLIGSEDYQYETKSSANISVKKTATRTRTFKVVNNLLGRSVSSADNLVDLWKPPTGLELNLPRIPIQLIDKIDSFFRHVDEKLKTESIVILTYDSTIGGMEGWGFVVPKQENTAAACDYDPPSVMAHMPKTAFIAGSAHSHPHMPAYASHTDTGDQLDFDGIHITFGWSYKTRNQTEYHIEVQMHGLAYEFIPSDIFGYPPKELLPEDELDEFMKFVEKKTFTGGYHGQGKGQASPGGGMTGTKTNTNTTSQSGGFKLPEGVAVYLSEDAPDPYNNLIIGKMDIEHDHMCPFCETIVTQIDINHRRCFSCMFMLSDMNEGINELIAHRKKEHLTVTDFEKHSSVFYMINDIYTEIDVPASF